MTYPTIEAKKQKKEEAKAKQLDEAKMYVDSESFDEFTLNRAVAGIKHSWFNDAFKIYYICNDKFHWILRHEIMAVVAVAALSSTGFSVVNWLAATLSPGAKFITIVPWIACITGIAFAVLLWLHSNYQKAGKLILEANRLQKSFSAANQTSAHTSATSALSSTIMFSVNSPQTSVSLSPQTSTSLSC